MEPDSYLLIRNRDLSRFIHGIYVRSSGLKVLSHGTTGGPVSPLPATDGGEKAEVTTVPHGVREVPNRESSMHRRGGN